MDEKRNLYNKMLAVYDEIKELEEDIAYCEEEIKHESNKEKANELYRDMANAKRKKEELLEKGRDLRLEYGSLNANKVSR